MKTVKIFLFIISLLVISRSDAFAANPYSRSFPLKVAGLEVGELVLSFEDVIELGEFSIQLSNSSSSPSGSILPSLVTAARLPLLNSPLFITVNTTTSFRGPALLTLRIYALEYLPQVPLRFFGAAGTRGSLYRDFTSTAGRGSMYASGYRSGFSEFVLALDLRLLANIIDTKFQELEQALYDQRNTMPRNVAMDLGRCILRAHQAWEQGDKQESINQLEKCIKRTRDYADLDEIPFSYNDPANPFGNVGSDLIARSKTTIFSIKLAR
jgi:hypothetical protein